MMFDSIILRNKAQNQLVSEVVLPAKRGDIVDKGETFATSAKPHTEWMPI